MKALLSAAFLLFSSASLATASPVQLIHSHSDTETAHGGGDRLSHIDAIARSQQIEQVDYKLHFEFTKGSSLYNGKTEISAKLKKTDQPLFVDSVAEAVRSVSVNGVAAEFSWSKGRILIPARYLAPQTTIVIDYQGKFSPGVDGIFRVKDPKDGSEYIYTNLEPYGAHRVFPCFDQPDLKATFELSVKAPANWTVITNTTVTEKNADTSHFQKTLRFSTYLFFLGAGPYKAWHSEHKGLPLAIYARQSLAEHVDTENLFALTKSGLDFFQEYFDSPYPFPKYDHIFCPELGNGAMENPGAVSMNERMIFQGPASEFQLFNRANTLLHEMAHMWFGDLVTMRWWNDLWLNESFATYMASVAQDRITGQGQAAWQGFAGEKGWAYWQDQLVTTHPIVVAVEDTDRADSIFDGITYGKGAAVMKQLHFLVGENSFRDGLRAYFKKYAWKNTEMLDFMNEIAQASGVNLDQWRTGWLETAGLNGVTPEWTCRAGKIDSFRLRQEKSVTGILLSHRTRIGFFRKSAGKMELSSSLDASYEGALTKITDAIGLNCPDFVYTNLDDQDYALHSLDPVSLAALKGDLAQFTSPFLRQMLWSTLAEMVTDQKLRGSQFLEMAITGLTDEENVGVLGTLITNYGSLRNLFFFLNPKHRSTIGARLEAAAWNEVTEKRGNPSLTYLWTDYYAHIAHTEAGRANLKRLLSGNELSQDTRWAAIQQLSSLGDPEAHSLIEAEKAKDLSNSGENYAYGAQVNFPTAENKEKYWNEITDFTNDLSYSKRSGASRSFHSVFHPELSLPFLDRYFAIIRATNWEESGYLSDVVFGSLFPFNLCSAELLSRSRAELGATTLPRTIKNQWLEANQMLEECVRSRAIDK